MASDDKKIKTNPAPKNEVPSKDKGTSGVDTSKAEGAKIADASPSGYSRGEGQKPVCKVIRITGTRFSLRKRSDNSAAFFVSITDVFCFGKPMRFFRGCGTIKKGPEESGPSSFGFRWGLIVHAAHSRPCHRQAYRAPHCPSSAFRRPWLPW